MVYSALTFPQRKDSPFFYTSFVATVDGKVWVEKAGYWPIGSKVDHERFTFLRAHADAIIDGKNTALRFGKNTIQTIHSDSFKQLRKQLGKKSNLQYFVVTSHPDEALSKALENPFSYKPTIFTEGIDYLIKHLKSENLNYVFIDGGPKLLASFLDKNLIDEVFLTISPKIFGSDGSASTMVEGILLAPDKINLKLVSSEKVGDEIFLRYKVIR